MAQFLTKHVFLYLMSLIYVCAFASLYVQIPGLYGSRGILPASNVRQGLPKNFKDFLGQPSLLRFASVLHLNTEEFMDLLAITGLCLAGLTYVFSFFRTAFVYFILWALYQSLFQVGQTFLWFQWDILLLEAGFLTCFVAPIFPFRKSTNHDNITLWLIKWLLFRLMFASGVVKLTSQCPTWWGLTALNYHYESQCIPTPLAWFAHQLPEWFQKLSVVITYVIEIAVPFLFFAPSRFLTIFAASCQIFLMLLIMLSGNYNFFNLLTIVLCVPLVDDRFLFGLHTSTSPSRAVGGRFMRFLVGLARFTFNLLVLAVLTFFTIQYFNLELSNDYRSVTSKIEFSSSQFTKWIDYTVPLTITGASVLLGFQIVKSLVRSIVNPRRWWSKLWSLFSTTFYSLAAVTLFSVSLVPHARLSTASVTLPVLVKTMFRYSTPVRLTSSYGLFRRMTGVGGRPEVIIEGSNSPNGPWLPYEFLYKPGNVSTRPPVVAPHQPRLDWQMWFAALGSYQHNPWFLNLIYRLLTNEKEVTALIAHNPFSKKPPILIRSKLYHYFFTRDLSKSEWWSRKYVGEYSGPLSLETPDFIQYIKSNQLDKKFKRLTEETQLHHFIHQLRRMIGQPEGFIFVMSHIITLYIVKYTLYLARLISWA